MPLIWWYIKGMETKEPETKITVRIPAEIADKMRQLAKRHDRSLNGEIVRALREYTERTERSAENREMSRDEPR
jgi:predicted transcriptional regulator